MAAPSFGAKGTANATTTNSNAPTCPAGVTAGMILFVVSVKWAPNTTVSDPTISGPSGFDEVPNSPQELNPGTPGDGVASLFWKRAVGTESSTVLSLSATGDTGNDTCFYSQVYRFSDCISTGDPFDAVAAGAWEASVPDILFNDVSVLGSERTIMGVLTRGGGNTSYTPSGYTLRAGDNTTTGADAEIEIWTIDNVSTSPGSVDLNQNASDTIPAVTYTVSLKPEGAAPVDKYAGFMKNRISLQATKRAAHW